MKSTLTLVFSVLFLVVLAVYWQLEKGTTSALLFQKSLEDEVSQLMPLEENDEVVLIQIQKPVQGLLVNLQKEKDSWKITKPVQSEADPLLVEGLVQSLKLSTKLRRLQREKGWEEYGLLRPELRIGIETKNHRGRRYLNLGDTAPVGDNVFARWDDDKEYFLLDSGFKKAFSQSLYSLRNKKIFDIQPSQMTRLHIKNGDMDYELARQKTSWFWMDPIPVLGEVVDPAFVETLMQGINNLFVKEFLDDDPLKPEDAGLKEPASFIQVWKGDESSQTLEVGIGVDVKDAYLVRRQPDGLIFLISHNKMDEFLEQVEEMTDKTLAKMTPLSAEVKAPSEGAPAQAKAPDAPAQAKTASPS